MDGASGLVQNRAFKSNEVATTIESIGTRQHHKMGSAALPTPAPEHQDPPIEHYRAYNLFASAL